MLPAVVSHGAARRMRGIVAAVLLLPSATGCYSSRMVPEGSAIPGRDVSLGINDRGRVGLGGRMGPGVLRINGRLVARTDSEYVVRVASVDFVEAGASRWSNEQVSVPTEFVGGVTERRLSKARSWLTAGIVAAALVAFGLTVDLIGGGREGGDGREPGNNNGQTS